MKTVWKYTLKIDDYDEFEMPVGSKILSVGEQDNKLVMWVEVNDDIRCKKEVRKFRLAGTGHIINEIYTHFIGSVLMMNGVFVVHVFEILE